MDNVSDFGATITYNPMIKGTWSKQPKDLPATVGIAVAEVSLIIHALKTCCELKL